MATDTSTGIRAELHALIDALPDDELAEAKHYLTGLALHDDPALRTALLAPMDDEPLTAEDIAAIEEAKARVERGEWVSHDDVRRELGW